MCMLLYRLARPIYLKNLYLRATRDAPRAGFGYAADPSGRSLARGCSTRDKCGGTPTATGQEDPRT